MTIQTKRVYEPALAEDGARFLVDRLWPRGVKKEALRLDGWLKDVAPSDELRRWFGHDPARWPEFRRRYFAELDQHPEGLQPLREAARRGPVTLLFGASDTRHNNAVALCEYLRTKESMSANYKWVPVVDEDLCNGCGVCVEACGPKSLAILDRVAVLVRPDTCGSEEHCITPCPTAAIQMRWVQASGDKARGKWRTEASLADSSNAVQHGA